MCIRVLKLYLKIIYSRSDAPPERDDVNLKDIKIAFSLTDSFLLKCIIFRIRQSNLLSLINDLFFNY